MERVVTETKLQVLRFIRAASCPLGSANHACFIGVRIDPDGEDRQALLGVCPHTTVESLKDVGDTRVLECACPVDESEDGSSNLD